MSRNRYPSVAAHLPPSLKKSIEEFARNKNLTISDVIVRSVRTYLIRVAEFHPELAEKVESYASDNCLTVNDALIKALESFFDSVEQKQKTR